MKEIDLYKYIGIHHEYGKTDCITLVTDFYENEFDIKIALPSYSNSRSWMREFTTDNIDAWAINNANKINIYGNNNNNNKKQ